MMSTTENCPRCHQELPAMLIQAHLESCDAIVDEDPEGPLMELDVDKSFLKLMEGLDLPDPAPADWVNVQLLDELELSRRYNQTREDLLASGEMLNPTTQAGRDLHSERAAYLIEMKRRKML